MRFSKFLLGLCAVLAFSGVVFAARADDLDGIRAKGALRHLGVNYANFITGSGDGFDVEMMQGFAKHLGVKYVFVETNFYNIVRDLLGKDVVRKGDEIELAGDYPIRGDVIATGFTMLPWREKAVLFSKPTFPSQVWLVARADSPLKPVSGGKSLNQDIEETKAKIGSKSLLVMEKTCLDPTNYGLKGKGIDLRLFTRTTNLNEMVPALLNGEADLTLLDVPDAMLDLKKWAGRVKVLGPISEEQELAVAFRKSGPRLRDAFDAYLAKMRTDGSYDALVDKYYPGIRSTLPAFFAKYPSH